MFLVLYGCIAWRLGFATGRGVSKLVHMGVQGTIHLPADGERVVIIIRF